MQSTLGSVIGIITASLVVLFGPNLVQRLNVKHGLINKVRDLNTVIESTGDANVREALVRERDRLSKAFAIKSCVPVRPSVIPCLVVSALGLIAITVAMCPVWASPAISLAATATLLVVLLIGMCGLAALVSDTAEQKVFDERGLPGQFERLKLPSHRVLIWRLIRQERWYDEQLRSSRALNPAQFGRIPRSRPHV